VPQFVLLLSQDAISCVWLHLDLDVSNAGCHVLDFKTGFLGGRSSI
jgi:hypothetical protein